MDLIEIAKQFCLDREPLDAQPYGCGHINDTYCVNAADKRYILQRINHRIFPNVEGLMNNIVSVTDVIRKQVLQNGGDVERECFQVIPTKDGKSFFEHERNFYRMYVFVEKTLSLQVVENPLHFYYENENYFNFIGVASLPSSWRV